MTVALIMGDTKYNNNLNTKFDFNGIIYAPNGTVTITGYDVKFNGIIIANKIFITGTNTEITNTVDLSKLEG